MDDKERAFLAETINTQSYRRYLNAKDSDIYPLLEDMAKSHNVSELDLVKAAQLSVIMERLEKATDSETGNVPETLNENDILKVMNDFAQAHKDGTVNVSTMATELYGYMLPLIRESFRYGYYQAIRDEQ